MSVRQIHLLRVLPMCLMMVGLLAAEDPPYVSHTVGTQKVLVVFAQFDDTTANLPSESTWNNVVTSLRSWMHTKSYGRSALQFTLLPSIAQLPGTKSSYTNSQMMSAARQYATSQGFTLSHYQRFWLAVSPHGSTGLAQPAGVNFWISFGSGGHVRHEIAHTYGTIHPTGWDDSALYAPSKQRFGWLTESDISGFRVIQRRQLGEVRGLMSLIDAESSIPVPQGVRGLRIHGNNVFTPSSHTGRTQGLFLGLNNSQLFVYQGDNMVTTTYGRYYLQPGELHTHNIAVLDGATLVTRTARTQYLRSGKAASGQPVSGLVALSLVQDGDTMPIAGEDMASTVVNVAVDIPVLANDATGGNGSLSIAAVDSVSDRGGSVSQVGAQIRYTPPAGFTGIDTFSYVVTNGGPYALGRVLIQVGSTFAGTLVAWDDFESGEFSGGYGWASPWLGTGYLTSSIAGTDGNFAAELKIQEGKGTLSRSLDLSGTIAPRVSIRWRGSNFALDSQDRVAVELDSGSGWQTVLTARRVSGETPNSGTWYQAEADIHAFAGQPAVTLRLRCLSTTNRLAQVDNVAISDHAAPSLRSIVFNQIDDHSWTRLAPASEGTVVGNQQIFDDLSATVSQTFTPVQLAPSPVSNQ